MNTKIDKAARSIVKDYWLNYTKHQKEQYAFRFSCIAKMIEKDLSPLRGKSSIDIGGGWGFFSALCASLGMNSWLIDDFQDSGFKNSKDPRKKMPEKYGFKLKEVNILKEPLGMDDEYYDLITTFDVFEHLHSSPKKIILQSYKALKKGGLLVIGVPNCVRLTKRISTMIGKSSWSDFDNYFFSETFRGHVREYSVEDLNKIAKFLNSNNYKIIGRNFNGMESSNIFVRSLARFLFYFLMPMPKLCDSIFLILKKI